MKYIGIIFPILSERFTGATLLNKVIKTLESLLSLILIIYIIVYASVGSYSNKIKYCDNQYFTFETTIVDCENINVYSIESPLVYNFLALSLDEKELGFTGLTDSIFLNQNSINSSKTSTEEIYVHELEHINQRTLLGLISYHKAPAWVLEGGAEYFRGRPTIPVCENVDNNQYSQKQVFYKESWMQAYHYLKIVKLDYLDYLQLKKSDKKNIKDIEEEVIVNFCE